MKICYGKAAQSTEEDKKGGTDPKWDQCFDFPYDKEVMYLDIIVMEKTNEIARGRFSLLSLSEEEFTRVNEVRLYRNFHKASRVAAGTLKLQLEMMQSAGGTFAYSFIRT